jgi:glycosyltransferase involved in cell wall biosynthesis
MTRRGRWKEQAVDVPRKVLFAPVLFHAEPWNGIMEHLRVLIGALDRDAFQPVLATRPDDGEQTRSLAERAHVETVDFGASRSVRPLWRVLHQVRPDVVHVHTPSTSGLTKLALAARLARVQVVVVTLHQVAPDVLAWRNRVVNRVGQFLIDTTVAVSTGVADTQSRRAGLSRRRIEVVRNGVPDAPLVAPEDDVVSRKAGEIWAGYFGRLAEEKGIDTLVDATARVRRAGDDLRLLIVGDGYELAALQSQARAAGCADAVVFTGYRSDARTLMTAVDIVVHPPRFEGFGLVVAEAMAAARPVVATNVAGGIPEMVDDGRTGLLVPYGDAEAMAGALGRLCRDRRLRDELGRAGRARYLDGFTVQEMTARTLRLYTRRPPKWGHRRKSVEPAAPIR